MFHARLVPFPLWYRNLWISPPTELNGQRESARARAGAKPAFFQLTTQTSLWQEHNSFGVAAVAGLARQYSSIL